MVVVALIYEGNSVDPPSAAKPGSAFQDLTDQGLDPGVSEKCLTVHNIVRVGYWVYTVVATSRRALSEEAVSNCSVPQLWRRGKRIRE